MGLVNQVDIWTSVQPVDFEDKPLIFTTKAERRREHR